MIAVNIFYFDLSNFTQENTKPPQLIFVHLCGLKAKKEAVPKVADTIAFSRLLDPRKSACVLHGFSGAAEEEQEVYWGGFGVNLLGLLLETKT